MATDTDILWGMYLEHCAEERHHEEQRATMTGVVLALAGAIVGLLAIKDLSPNSWPLSVFLVMLGLFGAMLSAKHYEKSRFHARASGHYRNQVEKRKPRTELRNIRFMAAAKHQDEKAPLRQIRLHVLWTGIHVSVVILGILMTVYIVKL